MSLTETITSLAARGDGVTASGRFVAGAVPGDDIAADGTIIPGPHRIAPLCRHFGRCGGCQLQHIDDATYADFLTDRVSAPLATQGVNPDEIRPAYLSPPGTRRRVAMRALKLGKRVVLGFAEAKSNHLVDIAECPVMAGELQSLVDPLRALLAKLSRDRKPIEVHLTLADQGVAVLLSGGVAEGLAATEALTGFAARHALARLSIDDGFGPQLLWAPSVATATFGGVAVELPEAAFLQATRDGEAQLVAAVNEAVGRAKAVADLFAGLGTFSLAINARITAVEGARDAATALATAANRGVRQIRVEHRDLFRRPLTTKELAAFDAVILDPPRAGAKEQVVELAKSSVPRISYVSCNPATFARDAKNLIDGGYALKWVKPVGQFRWSTHVELASLFERC